MPTVDRVCGECERAVPALEHFKSKRFEPMNGFLACLAKQATAEDKARFISPHRDANYCAQFVRK